MSKDPAKDFGVIADDYVFFETHSTEAASDAAAYVEHLAAAGQGRGRGGKSLRMLDFGCGSGTFTVRLLELLDWPVDQLELTLVEPAEVVRKLAVERLGRFTRRPIAVGATLAGSGGEFDFVMSNHALYYVPQLEMHLQQLVEAVAPGGLLAMAIAGRDNALVELWLVGFESLGREIPYHTAEDVEAALVALGVRFEKRRVPYGMDFADTEENRMKMLRFLLADHLAELPREKLLAVFDQHARGGRIQFETASEHFVVRGDR
jgi:SAM-dependent methyltransferase